VRHQVRPPCYEFPESGSLASQELKSGSLDAEPSPDLVQELEISAGQGAARSSDVASGSKSDELGVIGVSEEAPLCETRSAMQFEVDEDGIINKSEAVEGEGSGNLESMSSRARATAAPNSSHNGSWFHFAAAERMGSSVLNGEVSVAQRNVPPSRSVIWSGFAALCGICIVFLASKLSRGSSKARLRRKLFDMHRPVKKEDEFDKGNLNVFRNGQEYPYGLPGRPQLDRKELMTNIKKAQKSRKWFVLSNSFQRKDVATYGNMNIPEVRRIVAEEHTSEEGTLERYFTDEENDIVIPQPIGTIEEVSANYSSQSYVDEVSDSRESNGVSLSKDKIDESMEQTVGLTNGAQIMNMSEKDQRNIGDTDVPEPSYSNEIASSTDDRNSMIYIGDTDVPEPSYSNEIASSTDDRNSMIYILEREEQVSSASANVHESRHNSASTPSEFDIKEIEAIRNSASIAHTTRYEEFSHNMSVTDTEACKTHVVAETMTAASPQRSREEPADLRKDNVQSMREVEPSFSSGNVKQLSHGIKNEHEERIVHNETQTRTETGHAAILSNDSTPSFLTLQEETVQNTFAEVSKTTKKKVKNKPKAHIRKKKSKLQTYSDKESETQQSEQGKPGSETMVNPTNCVEKTKQVPKKQQKKVQNEMQIVLASDDVQCSSMVDQKNNSQRVKKARRKKPKNAFHNQGTQTREESVETAHVINSPANATTDNIKPHRIADSSLETQLSKVTVRNF
jgi:hypothetical protein